MIDFFYNDRNMTKIFQEHIPVTSTLGGEMVEDLGDKRASKAII